MDKEDCKQDLVRVTGEVQHLRSDVDDLRKWVRKANKDIIEMNQERRVGSRVITIVAVAFFGLLVERIWSRVVEVQPSDVKAELHKQSQETERALSAILGTLREKHGK